MHDVADAVAHRCVEQPFGCAKVVPHELGSCETADLRVTDDERRAVFETGLPAVVDGEIGFDDAHRGLILREYRRVLRMLVDADNRAKPASQEAWYEVLPDQTGCAGHDDALLHSDSGERADRAYGESRGTTPIGRSSIVQRRASSLELRDFA